MKVSPAQLAAFKGIAALEELPLWDASTFSPIEIPRLLCAHLGNPQDSIPTVHVAGTNGKGSVSTFLASMLIASGARVGQFTSPHLTHVAERCLLNGKAQSLSEFDAAVTEVMRCAAENSLEPSYFVVTAAACFLEFLRTERQWNVIEVGLGGLYDATNVIAAPEACVITSIGLDHTHILGESLEEIAQNKAGILKPGVPCVVGRVPEAARELIANRAAELQAPVYFAGEDFGFDSESRSYGVEVVPELFERFSAASYQRENLLVAAKVASVLGLESQDIANGAVSAHWPGRLDEIEHKGVSVLIDAAHNPDGIRALARYLETSFFPEDCNECVFLLGILERKNWQEMLGILIELQATLEARGMKVRWVCTEPDNAGALPAQRLASHLPAAQAVANPAEALSIALAACSAKTPLVVAGSIFLLGALYPLLVDAPFCTYRDTTFAAQE